MEQSGARYPGCGRRDCCADHLYRAQSPASVRPPFLFPALYSLSRFPGLASVSIYVPLKRNITFSLQGKMKNYHPKLENSFMDAAKQWNFTNFLIFAIFEIWMFNRAVLYFAFQSLYNREVLWEHLLSTILFSNVSFPLLIAYLYSVAILLPIGPTNERRSFMRRLYISTMVTMVVLSFPLGKL